MAQYTSLTDSLAKNVQIYQDYLYNAGLPQPCHSLGDPKDYNQHKDENQNTVDSANPNLPEDIAEALASAKESAYELYLLLHNPTEIITESFNNYGRVLSLNYIARHSIAHRLKADERKSFEALAAECKLDKKDLTRMLRLAMTEHIFEEPEQGLVAHTKASLALATVPNLDAWTYNFTNCCPMMSELPEAMEKWPGSEKELETAGALYRKRRGEPESAWQWFKENPEEAARFGKVMQFFASRPEKSIAGSLRAYEFFKLPQGAVFVDIGGSHGLAAIAVAEAHPHIKCIVQDISEPVITAGRDSLPPHLKDRVEYQVYDFFTEQHVKNADVYFFRKIFHDWSDNDCVRILKALIPSLKAGSRVLLNETCLPSHGEWSPYKQRGERMADMLMKSLANAQERDAEQWQALFHAADTRFVFQPIKRIPKMEASLIEAIWNP